MEAEQLENLKELRRGFSLRDYNDKLSRRSNFKAKKGLETLESDDPANGLQQKVLRR